MAYPPPNRGHPQNGYNNYNSPVERQREFQDDGYDGRYQQGGYGYDDDYSQNYNQGQRPPPQRQYPQRQQPQGHPPQGRPPPQRGPVQGYGREPRDRPPNGQYHGNDGGYQQRRPPPRQQQNGYDNGYQEQYQDQYDDYHQNQYGFGHQQDEYQHSQRRGPAGPSQQRSHSNQQQGYPQNGYDQRQMNAPRKQGPPPMNQPRPPPERILAQQPDSPVTMAWDNPFPSFPAQQKMLPPDRPSTASGRYQESRAGSRGISTQQPNGIPDRRENYSVPNQAREPQPPYNNPHTMSPPEPAYARPPQRSNTMPNEITQEMSNLNITPAVAQRQGPQHFNFSQPRRPSAGTVSASTSRHQSQSTQNGNTNGYDDFLDTYAEEPEEAVPFTSPGTEDMPNFGATKSQGTDKTLHMVPPTPNTDHRGRQDHQAAQQQLQRSRSQSDDYRIGFGQAAPKPAFAQHDQQYPPRNLSKQDNRSLPSGQQYDGQAEFGPPVRAQTDAFGPGQVVTRNPSDPYQRAPSRGIGLPNGPSPTGPLPPQPLRNGTPVGRDVTPVNGSRTLSDNFNRPRPGGTPVNAAPVELGRPSNPDSLPGHPVPIRPGLMNQTQSPPGVGARPPPVRNYNGSPASNVPYQQTPPPGSLQQRPSPQQQAPLLQQSNANPLDDQPITYEELQRLRGQVQQNPNDLALQLRLAKRMVEAAATLADEGGRADARTKKRNQEKYTQDANKIVKKLVAANSTDAMFYMAECHGSGGLGLNKDPGQAFTLYQSAAKLNHAAAAYRVAVCCELGADEGGGTKRDPLKAVQWYQRAATLGDVPAMYKTGVIKLKGLLGQPQNPREAITWLKRAAEQADADNPHALHELALLYMNAGPNDNIIRDEGYAAELMCQAAELGYKFSQYKLGEAFEFGYMGFPIDPRQSITWYSKAATQEEHKSELALSGWYLTGAEGLMASNEQEAYLWAKKSANSGFAKAEYAMGYYTETGIGCQADIEGAKRWYWKAASQNFPKARERLENLRRGGPKMQKARVSRTTVTRDQGDCKMM